jgi:hypothetical protein
MCCSYTSNIDLIRAKDLMQHMNTVIEPWKRKATVKPPVVKKTSKKRKVDNDTEDVPTSSSSSIIYHRYKDMRFLTLYIIDLIFLYDIFQ